MDDDDKCSRCGANLLDFPSEQVGDDLCFDCRYEEDADDD